MPLTSSPPHTPSRSTDALRIHIANCLAAIFALPLPLVRLHPCQWVRASSRHLTCDGIGCQDCPKGYISNVGSLLIGMKEREEERESVCAFVVCDGLCVSAMCVFACLSVCRVRSYVYLCINSCMDSLAYTNLDVYHKISTSPAHLLPCFYVFSNMLSDVFSNVPPVMHTLNPEP